MYSIIAKIKRRLVLMATNRLSHWLCDPLEKLINPYDKSVFLSAALSGYSVVIITAATDLVTLENTIASIDQELAGSPAEIIIVAPSKLKLTRAFTLPIKLVPYRDLNFLSAMITRKKNLGVRHCQYDKVVLTHDYILFEAGWKAGWDKFGTDFAVAMNPIKDQDGSRFRDWLVLDYPGIGAGFLPYHAEATPYQYISGTYFVVKRDFYLANPLDESLRWGEGEDIEWSKRIRTKTIFKFNPDSVVRCSKLKGSILIWEQNNLTLEKIFAK